MPVRPNPYVSSGSSYGSRSLAPIGNLGGGNSAVALPLAQLVSGIIDYKAYDPSMDPNRQNAAKTAYDLKRKQEQDVVAAQNANLLGDQYVPLGDIAAKAYGSGVAPEEVGKTLLLANAIRGRGDTSIDDFMMEASPMEVAAGRGGSSTFAGGTYGNRMAPTKINGPNGPELVAAQDSYGSAPVLSDGEVKGNMLGELAGSMSRPEQMRTVGAAPLSEAVLNYIGPNNERGSGPASQIPTGPGYTAFTGQGTGTPDQLRPTVRGDLQSQSIANEQFGRMLTMTEDIARRDPTLFGVSGNVRRLAQNVGQQVANVKQLAPGSGLGEAFSEAQQRAAQSGINLLNPMEYDPNLSDIVTMSELLIFGAAEALASQQGRSVSDKDVALFRSIVGDPTGWTSSQEQFLSKAAMIRQVLNMKQEVIGGALGGGLGDAAAAAVAPGTSNPAAVPEADADFDYVPGKGLVPRR